jgi:ankyrin repeat protein
MLIFDSAHDCIECLNLLIWISPIAYFILSFVPSCFEPPLMPSRYINAGCCCLYIYQTQNGYTALMWAAEEGRAECVRMLIDDGAALDIKANSVRGFGFRALFSCFNVLYLLAFMHQRVDFYRRF